MQKQFVGRRRIVIMLKDLGRQLVGEPPDSLIGVILVNEKRNPQYPHVLERVDYVCEGGPYYHIAGNFISVNHTSKGIITLGGIRFRIVDFYPHKDAYLVRIEGRMAVVNYWLRRLTKKLDLVYRRLILTAAVWNLATIREGYILSWRDLKWFGEGRDDG